MKIGLSSCSKTINDELFLNYKNAGIEAMEISIGAVDQLWSDYSPIKELSEKYGVELWSFHIPFAPFEEIDISSTDEAIRQHTVEFFCDIIKKVVTETGINKFVIHPSGEPIQDEERAARMECSKKSLAVLAEYADKLGAVIAVEDLPRTCLGRNSNDMIDLLSADERLRVCFDTNHLLSENFEDFIKKVGNKIITTHISDYDFTDEMHWLPGEGDLDWQKLYKALSDVGYTGAWLYELGFGAGRKIERCRDLTCEDFANNAKEIFDNKKLTVIERK